MIDRRSILKTTLASVLPWQSKPTADPELAEAVDAYLKARAAYVAAYRVVTTKPLRPLHDRMTATAQRVIDLLLSLSGQELPPDDGEVKPGAVNYDLWKPCGARVGDRLVLLVPDLYCDEHGDSVGSGYPSHYDLTVIDLDAFVG